MKRSLILYPLLIGLFSFLIWQVLDSGKKLVPKINIEITAARTLNMPVVDTKPVVVPSSESIWEQYLYNIKNPMGLLLLQIITILFISKLFGMMISRFGQPSVVGEMLAGIFLGPSVLGFIFPAFSEFLFPKATLSNIQFLSQIGLAFFMFVVGMELDMKKLKGKASNALVISHASIVIPFFLGVLVSYFIYEDFAPAHIPFLSFALFMGIAISITAFPVLARILQERQLNSTALGAIAIACAAFDDITAWCILAIVIAIVKAGSIISALFTIALAILFVLLMFYIVRPRIEKNAFKYRDSAHFNKKFVALAFFVMLISAYITETIGIHALFGAFLAGVMMPQNVYIKDRLREKIEDVSVLFLLPLFFAFTGLRTQIGLLNDSHLWLICGLIVFIAVFGKFGGSAMAAKLMGQTWRDSFSIGALMNTRGLMELIVLNIGYDLGVVSPSLFAIMVIMALSTTLMTGPLLGFIERFHKVPKVEKAIS